MFTGLIEDIGTCEAVVPEGSGLRICVHTSIDLDEVALGDSIATMGVCLTVDALRSGVFEAVAAQETVAISSLATLRPGRRVHLERALRVGDRLGGHMVQGHVDGTGTVTQVKSQQETLVLWVELPKALQRYVVPKGSICIDGVSLTINEVEGCRVRLNVVPHTSRNTCLGALRTGDVVNIETDVIARYVERLLDPHQAGQGLTVEALMRHGFIG